METKWQEIYLPKEVTGKHSFEEVILASVLLNNRVRKGTGCGPCKTYPNARCPDDSKTSRAI
jgi:hypothetical protein